MSTDDLPLHTHKHSLRIPFNRLFALIYWCAILALLYHHTLSLLHSTTLTSFFITLTLLISDSILAFSNITTQAFRMNPLYRKEYPENLKRVLRKSDLPALDVFICTADPYKEPPMNVVNTALSVMAYDYPTEKVSVYVSDDGGSALTLFAFMEAAKFARHWLPFCRENNIVERCPEAFFETDHSSFSEAENIKIMYQGMKVRVDNVIERGKVDGEYIIGERESQVFSKWSDGFIRQDHPTIIQVLSDNNKERDITDNTMPNLIYVSREKNMTSEHNFKAGALNVLIRVSATMTNAPIVLTLDCDMYSNDPQTLYRVLCYLSDPKLRSKLGYVQFPQRFRRINKNDIYACEFKRIFVINAEGMDGVLGPDYFGTGCFFSRRAFFGGPSQLLSPEIPELAPDNVVDKPIQSTKVLELAHRVAACNYERNTIWGRKIGVRYGSLVEDFFTGYQMQCEGWKSIFCNPARAAFYGDAPINLVDVLDQIKRWTIGNLEVAFSKYSPVTFGIRAMGILMGLSYAHYSFWPIWSIPITVYAFLPQLAILNGINIFPKVSETWFLLYAFLFIGAYTQDFIDFVVEGGTFPRWWNDQRMWMVRALSSLLFGSIAYLLKSLGISTHVFNVTSKVLDDDQSIRYELGTMEFGVPSPMFVPLTMAALLNLAAFIWGHIEAFRGSNDLEGLFLQMFIAGFGVVNCIPIYEAIISRNDEGRIPRKFKDGLECAVCLSDLVQGEKARLLPKCYHGFHVECIDMWFQSHSTCPLCRNAVVPGTLNHSDSTASSELTDISVQIPSPAETLASGFSLESPNFPTNVLFWGNQTRVSSGPGSGLEEGPSSQTPCPSSSSDTRRPEGMLVIDIPSENPMTSLASPSPSGNNRFAAAEEDLKSPVTTRLRSLKRLLSRDRRISPCSPSSAAAAAAADVEVGRGQS